MLKSFLLEINVLRVSIPTWIFRYKHWKIVLKRMEGGQPGLRLLTWNVNGVRSLVSFPAWLTNQAGADIVCLQGTGFQNIKIIFAPFGCVLLLPTY